MHCIKGGLASAGPLFLLSSEALSADIGAEGGNDKISRLSSW